MSNLFLTQLNVSISEKVRKPYERKFYEHYRYILTDHDTNKTSEIDDVTHNVLFKAEQEINRLSGTLINEIVGAK